MKFFVAVLALVAVAHADVSHLFKSGGNSFQGASSHAAASYHQGSEALAETLKFDSDVAPDRFSYHYETSNGISGQEVGQLKNAGQENAAIEVQGSNQYTAPDGSVIQTSYVADENGYQPQGAHLPTPPAPLPIPEYIVRALEYIRTHPPKPEPGQRF